MAVSAVDLDEIVVIGYGTQRRGDITGSVSSVSREEFRAGSVRDAAHLIQGITPGAECWCYKRGSDSRNHCFPEGDFVTIG